MLITGKMVVLLIAIMAFISFTPAYAGNWVDDWIAGQTSTSSGYFAGQQRGYFNGGSFSLHTNSTSGDDNVFTITPPQIKAGCGGIDVNMGGFSFMNSNYLVSKLESILSSAPAVAFDLALKTLCTPCSEVMNAMNAAADFLNHIQLNSCKAAQALAATALSSASDAARAQYGQVGQQYMMSTGMYSLFNDATQAQTNAGGSAGVSTAAVTSSCPSQVQSVFLTPGTLLSNMASISTSIDEDYVSLFRGLYGDIGIKEVTQSDGTIVIEYTPIKSCGQNGWNPDSLINKFLSNVIYSNTATDPENPNCTINSSTALTDYVNNNITGLFTSLTNHTDITPFTPFVDTIGMPLYSMAKISILQGDTTGTGMKSAIMRPLEVLYVYGMMNDLFDTMMKVAFQAKMIALQSASNGNNDTCQYNAWNKGVHFLTDADGLIPALKNDMRNLYESKKIALQEMTTFTSMANQYEAMSKQANAQVLKLFTPTINKTVLGH